MVAPFISSSSVDIYPFIFSNLGESLTALSPQTSRSIPEVIARGSPTPHSWSYFAAHYVVLWVYSAPLTA